MKELLVVRHAKSSWKNQNLSDHERPLNGRGRRDAPRMGRLLAEERLLPDLVITSTAERALATAEAMALAAGYEQALQLERQLYHADAVDYVAVLTAVDDTHQRVMVVAHNPGSEELVEVLTGEPIRMTTANIARIQLPIKRWLNFEDVVDAANGVLLGHWLPRGLKG